MCDENSKCHPDAIPPSVFRELASPHRDEDEMDDETISALINKYHLSQEVVLLKLRGYSLLNHISLSLTNDEYLAFVGYDTCYRPDGAIKSKASYTNQDCLKQLTTITTLRHIILQFQVLKPEHYIVSSKISWDPWGLQDPERRISCQKKLVDIVLTLGYELLQRIRKVTISGHVKTSNRVKWDPLLRDRELKSLPRERRDMEDEVKRILAIPAAEL
ncbi:uncharacterized protein J4E88_000018 [Alternaria novae-zelandiae]|uniref:uncharacterized protein n=1 Tax=Alternaria novae-zelandiae TaxID=430562 RepID=UPI0020C2EE27|nr:uncharacterized protein J4E88_000018 [Alternaria novae-zelandiae]KAI4695848.1 hypothetical protein J4E88_000018 [Alternaria novae-zelandiae]